MTACCDGRSVLIMQENQGREHDGDQWRVQHYYVDWQSSEQGLNASVNCDRKSVRS